MRAWQARVGGFTDNPQSEVNWEGCPTAEVLTRNRLSHAPPRCMQLLPMPLLRSHAICTLALRADDTAQIVPS